MKVLLLGDTHFGARGDNQIVLDHFIDYYQNTFFKLVEDIKPDVVLQLGDLLDRRKFANFSTLNRIRHQFIGPLTRDLKVPLWVLVGNHDTYYRNTLLVNGISQSFGDFISDGSIRLFDEPAETEAGLIIPWICADNYDRVQSIVSQSKSEFCYGHFELTGYDMYRGIPCEHGDDPNFLNRFKQVYSGHFHTHSRKNNICYVGTPYDIIWSDASDNKYVMALDTSTGKEEWFRNPSKLHHKVLLDSKSMQITDAMNQDYSHLKDKFVKLIILNGDKPDVIEVTSKAIRAVGPVSFTIVDSSSSDDLLGSSSDIDSVSHKDPLTALVDEVDSKFATTNPEKAKRIKTLANEFYAVALAGSFE